MAETLTESALKPEERAHWMSLVNESDRAHGKATAQVKPNDPLGGLGEKGAACRDPKLCFSVATLGWKTTE